jgi:hypothetical protein
MAFVYIALGVLSLPATLVLSNLFWRGFRETRAIAIVLNDQNLLSQVVTASVLANPPEEVARHAVPPYSMTIVAFQQADEAAHARARGLLRVAVAVVVLASGVCGFLGLGWFGLAIPLLNVLVMHTTFMGSTQGKPDRESFRRGVEHVQILAVILHRWRASDARAVRSWIQGQAHLNNLHELLTGL